jgi:hypothetical protein
MEKAGPLFLTTPNAKKLHARFTRLGGLEIDDQLELRRLLDGEIGRLGSMRWSDVADATASSRLAAPQQQATRA